MFLIPAVALSVHWRFERCQTRGPGLCGRLLFVGAHEWGGKSGIGEPDYSEYVDAPGSKYSAAAGFGPPTRPLNASLHKAKLADACADDRFDRSKVERDTTMSKHAID